MKKVKRKRVLAYKTKYTQEDLDQMEATIIRCSQAYRWLRQDAGLSKNKIRKNMDIRFDRIFEVFRYPFENMKLHHAYDIADMLPDKTLYEVMVAIFPKNDKQWYEIDPFESVELKNYFDKFRDEE